MLQGLGSQSLPPRAFWAGSVLLTIQQGFFLKSFKHTGEKNNLKLGALPTKAKTDTVELCHFVLQPVKKIVVASSECPRTYIFKD